MEKVGRGDGRRGNAKRWHYKLVDILSGIGD
jgi:hypothetical protein